MHKQKGNIKLNLKRVNTKKQTIYAWIAVMIWMIVILILVILPVWMVLVNSTRSTEEIQLGVTLLPSKYLIANYKYLLSIGVDMWQGFSNSLFLAMTTTVISTYFGMLTAYALVVYNFRGSKFFYNRIKKGYMR